MMRDSFKLFLGLVLAELIATALRLLAHDVRPGMMTSESLQHSVDPLGNLLFVLLLAGFVWRFRGIRLGLAGTAAAAIAFLVFILILVICGIFAYDRLGFGLQVVALIGTIGYYPPGADVPLDYGMQLWLVSALLPILMGVLLGAALRRARPGPVKLED